jgi:hypothetical protein
MKPKVKYKGSFVMDAMVWLVCLLASVFTGLYLLLIIAFAYSLYRMTGKTTVCKECESINIIPINTPIAQEILSNINKEIEISESDKAEQEYQEMKAKVLHE